MNFLSHSLRQKTRTICIVLVALLSLCVLVLPTEVIRAQAGGISEAINSFFFSVAMMAGGLFVTIGGWALEQSLQKLVFQMGELMGPTSGIGVSVNTVWLVVRDGFNLMFIFGLIFIGLKLIWDAEDSGARKTLTRLIVAALLINFSLFIAKFIVDFSNIAALQVYNLMATTLQVNTGGGVQGFGAANIGIPGYIMHLVGLQTIATTVTGGFGLAVAIFIFLLFTGLVFLAGALMIITRFVMLCFYMIFAPVMFLGWILPKFMNAQEKWWNNFLKNAFFAPAYLFCLYIAMRILAGARSAGGIADGQTLGDNLGGIGGNPALQGYQYDPETGAGFQAVLFLIVALGFMIASILMASRMSIHGADTSMAMIKSARSRVQRTIGNTTSGAAARVARTTVGAGANKLANSQWMNRNAARFGAVGGRQVHQAVKNVADSSFDARQVKLGNKSIGSQLDIGEGKKGGFVTRQKEEKKIHDDYLKSLKERDVTTLEKEGKLEAEMMRLSPKYVAAQAVAETAKKNVDQKKVDLEVAKGALVEEEKKKTNATVLENAAKQKFEQDKSVADTELTTAKQRLTDAQKTAALDPVAVKEAEEAVAAAEQKKAAAEAGIQQSNTAIETKEAAFAESLQGLTNKVTLAEKELQTATIKKVESDGEVVKERNLAKTNVKYENQLSYIQSLDNSAKRWDNAVTKLTNFSGGTGALGGAALGQSVAAAASGAAVAAAVTAGVTAGTAHSKKETVAALRKDWGMQGETKAKDTEEEKQLAKIVKQMTEAAAKPAEPAPTPAPVAA